MRRTINLFMWGYQQHFRVSMQRRAHNVLALAGAGIQPKALLVGVRDPASVDGHPVCVEPEDEEWDPSVFVDCAHRAAVIERDHPDWSMFYSDAPRMRDKPENIRRKAVSEAVKEVLDRWDSAHHTVSFIGVAIKVAGYYVVPVLQFLHSDLSALPTLGSRPRLDDYSSEQNLVEAIVIRLLEEAAKVLLLPEPGRYLQPFHTDPTSLLRDAGDSFASALTFATRDLSFQGVFEALNQISSLRYEGGESRGEILFVPADSEMVTISLRLAQPISLHRPKLARKTIEMSGADLCCVCTGSTGIVGLGTPQSSTGGLIYARFAGHYRWDLCEGSTVVMRVAYGVPRLPVSRLAQAEFERYVNRLFPATGSRTLANVWSLVEAALDQRHGTMLVLSAAAREEADRLAADGLRVECSALTPDLVNHLTSIDGAVLLDGYGICHAVGVILDGRATTHGDASRGARYNSAVRYVESSDHPTLCIVVSEDGNVDLVPRIRPQISRSTLAQNIEALKTSAIDTYVKPYHWLDEHRFYLTADECATVNAELKRIMSAPMELGEIRLEILEFTPNPAMNPSYYSPE